MVAPISSLSGRLELPGSWDVDEAGLVAIARRFAVDLRTRIELQPGQALVVHLSGELGAGKTTFVRAMLQELGVTVPVKSPTYTLIEAYDTAMGRVNHYDLYRISDPEELEFLGFRDSTTASAVTLIEWPEHGDPAIGIPHWHISIAYLDAGRRLQITENRHT